MQIAIFITPMASLLMSMPATTNKDAAHSPALSILESHNLATGASISSSSVGGILNSNPSPSDTPTQSALTLPPMSSSSAANASSSQAERPLQMPSSLSSFQRPAHAPTSTLPFSAADALRPVVKLRLGDKIKRIVLPKSEMASLTMIGLKLLVKKHFHLEDEFSMKFKDTEGDWVLLEDDIDLSNAIAIGPMLHVQVVKNDILNFESVKEIISSFQPQLESTLAIIKELLAIVDKQKCANSSIAACERLQNADVLAHNVAPLVPSTAVPPQQSTLSGNKQQDQMPFVPVNPMSSMQVKGSGTTEHLPHLSPMPASVPFPPQSVPQPSGPKPPSSFPYPPPPSTGPTPSGLHPTTHAPHPSMPSSPYPAPPASSGGHFPSPPQSSQAMQPVKPLVSSPPIQTGMFPGPPQQLGGSAPMMPPPPSGFHGGHPPLPAAPPMRSAHPQPPPQGVSGPPPSAYPGSAPAFQQGQHPQFPGPNPPSSMQGPQGGSLHHHPMMSGNQLHPPPGSTMYQGFPYQNQNPTQAPQASPSYR